MSTKNKKIFNTIGEALAYSIEINGLIPAEFSKKSGIDKGQLSHYLNNGSTPRPKTLRRFEEKLNVLIRKQGDKWVVIHDQDLYRAVDQSSRLSSAVDQLRRREPDDRASGLTEDDLPVLIRLRRELPELKEGIDEVIRKLIADF